MPRGGFAARSAKANAFADRDSRRAGSADREHRTVDAAPAPDLTVEQMARQLAEDPELGAWLDEVRYAIASVPKGVAS